MVNIDSKIRKYKLKLERNNDPRKNRVYQDKLNYYNNMKQFGGLNDPVDAKISSTLNELEELERRISNFNIGDIQISDDIENEITNLGKSIRDKKKDYIESLDQIKDKLDNIKLPEVDELRVDGDLLNVPNTIEDLILISLKKDRDEGNDISNELELYGITESDLDNVSSIRRSTTTRQNDGDNSGTTGDSGDNAGDSGDNAGETRDGPRSVFDEIARVEGDIQDEEDVIDDDIDPSIGGYYGNNFGFVNNALGGRHNRSIGLPMNEELEISYASDVRDKNRARMQDNTNNYRSTPFDNVYSNTNRNYGLGNNFNQVKNSTYGENNYIGMGDRNREEYNLNMGGIMDDDARRREPSRFTMNDREPFPGSVKDTNVVRNRGNYNRNDNTLHNNW